MGSKASPKYNSTRLDQGEKSAQCQGGNLREKQLLPGAAPLAWGTPHIAAGVTSPTASWELGSLTLPWKTWLGRVAHLPDSL